MRSIVKTALTGAVITGAGIGLGIAPAQAFTNGESPSVLFLAHVKALRFVGATNDRDIVNVGYDTCNAIKRGSTVTEVQGMAEATFEPKGYSANQADAFITYSIADLCPHAG